MMNKRGQLWSIGALTIGSIAFLPFFQQWMPFSLEKNRSSSTPPLLLASPPKMALEPFDGPTLCYATPLVESCYHWDISAAATYQKIDVQGAEVAIVTNDRTVTAYPVGAFGLNPVESFAWGFKLQANYRLSYEDWIVSAEYNYFKAVANTPAQSSYGQAFAPSLYTNQAVYTIGANPTLFKQLQLGSYTLLNQLRLLGFRPSRITPNLELTTSFGVEANFLQRRHIAVYTNGVNDTSTTGYMESAGGFLQNYQRYRWTAVGPTAGLHSDWHLGSNFSFFMDANGAITYGSSGMRTASFSNRVADIQSSVVTYNPQEAAVANTVLQFAPTMRYQLGFHYAYLIYEGSTQVNLDLAYETSYFFNVMRTVVPQGAYASENGSGLGMQGVVLQAGFIF